MDRRKIGRPAVRLAAGILAVILCACGQSVPDRTAARSGVGARLPRLSGDCLSHEPDCYTPQVLRRAYGIRLLLHQGVDGRGVTVVLPEIAQAGPALPPAITDLRQDVADFDSRFGLPPARIQALTTQAGPSSPPWLAGFEEVQDTELVHAIAPGATIDELLVNPVDMATPGRAAAEFTRLLRVASLHADVISFSVSLGEHFFSGAEVAAIHSALAYAAARHVTVIGSSGDDGVLGKGSITPPVKEVSLPASDPLVLAVGGTTLNADPTSGALIGQAAWDSPPGKAGGTSQASGGGFSHRFGRPSYQDGVPGIGAGRGVPDVAADASPYTGMAVARGAPDGTYMLTGSGGTSAAAPLWAGIIALADQEAGHSLGFINPAIYRIAAGRQSGKAFHDVTTGDNTMTVASASGPVTIAGYQAGPGWDPVTGWGTPDAQFLVPLLAG